MVCKSTEAQLADLYLLGREITTRLIEASSIEEAIAAREAEVAWRDEMLPFVERTFDAAVRARLYILNEIEGHEAAVLIGAKPVDFDHLMSMVCHAVRLYRLGKRLDGLDGGKPIALPKRAGRKKGVDLIDDTDLIKEAIVLINSGAAKSKNAAAKIVANGQPGHSEEATRQRINRRLRGLDF